MKHYFHSLAAAAALLCAVAAATAQEPSRPAADGSPARDSISIEGGILELDPIDTVSIKRKFVINDYSMIGVEYGPSMHMMNFTPEYNTKSFITPVYFGITYTHYSKMFGYMPYFGYQIGLFYGQEGYQFKENKETGAVTRIEGATKAVYNVAEVPFLLEGHVDGSHFKIMADVGPYAGYRLGISRTGDMVTDGLESSFADYDRRWDYGLYAGAGFGLVFEPLEFHIKARMRLSWGTIYDPDYYSRYYYRFAYPQDFIITAGIHFHLTKRTGKTRKDLRREAYDLVFGDKEAAQ